MGGLRKNRWEADRWYVGLVGGGRWVLVEGERLVPKTNRRWEVETSTTPLRYVATYSKTY